MQKATYIGKTIDYFDSFKVCRYLPNGAAGVYGSYWENKGRGRYVHIFIPDMGVHYFEIKESEVSFTKAQPSKA